MTALAVNGIRPGDRPGAPSVRALHAAAIRDAVADSFGITPGEIMSASRTAGTCWARQVAMWIISRETALSNPEIGRLFGWRDHTTVLHSIRRVEGKINADPKLRQWIEVMRLQSAGNSAGPVEADAGGINDQLAAIRSELVGVAEEAMEVCARMDRLRARTRILLACLRGREG